MAGDEIEWLIGKLLRANGAPSKTLSRRIIDAGPAIVPALLEIVTERELWNLDSPGAGQHPLNAARLLRQLPCAESAEPLLDVLAELDAEDSLFSEVIHALVAIGPPVVDPISPRLAVVADGLYRSAMIEILGQAGVRSEPVFEMLVAELERSPMAAAMSLADYGDSRAIPHLEAAFDREPLATEVTWTANMALFEIRATIEELGGVLDEVRAAKLASADEGRRMAKARALALALRDDVAGEWELGEAEDDEDDEVGGGSDD